MNDLRRKVALVQESQITKNELNRVESESYRSN